MGRGQSLLDLPGDSKSIFELERTLLDVPLQRFTIDQFEREEIMPVVNADLMNGTNNWGG